jgi:opacity protein-like surface antigen
MSKESTFADYASPNFNGSLSNCPFFDTQNKVCTTVPTNNGFAFNAPSANRFGWTIGVGTEWAVFDNWSVFGEWDYMNFGTRNVTFTDANLGSTQVIVKQQINELKLGINYRFGNPDRSQLDRRQLRRRHCRSG